MKVVIGIGNPYRRDNGVDPALTERLTKLVMSDVDVRVLDDEPTSLLDAWTDAPLAIIVDAVLSKPPRPGLPDAARRQADVLARQADLVAGSAGGVQCRAGTFDSDQQ